MTDPLAACIDCERHKDFVIEQVPKEDGWVCARCIQDGRPEADPDDAPDGQRTIQSFEEDFGEEQEIDPYV